MWTSPVLNSALCAGCILLTLSWASAAPAQEGQYRSRVMIDPGGTLDDAGQLSVEQLEQQLGALVDPYARATAERYLARHYLDTGDLDQAAKFYRSALDAEGLAPIANREMLRELARVYLLQRALPRAVDALRQVLQFALVPEAEDFLLLASALNRLDDHVAVVDALDRLRASGLSLDAGQLRRAGALYYAAGVFEQAAGVFRQLLQQEPGTAENWHQLAAIYLAQGRRGDALNLLTLARSKGIPFSERETLLLADLQATEKTPYRAAVTLQRAMTRGEVAASGEHYRKLFEFWLQARETKEATAALAQAARLTGDVELQLHLAQLRMEEESWHAMQETVLAACAKVLEDRFVARANLLLGISQLKLGDRESARRSFINATLIGGAGTQGGQWLAYMQAAEPTADEVRQIVSPCHGADDKPLRVAGAKPGEATAAAQPEPADGSGQLLASKTIPARVFLTSSQSLATLTKRDLLQPILVRMKLTLTRGGGAADGLPELHLKIPLPEPAEAGMVQLALPIRGAVRPGNRFRLAETDPFPCVWTVSDAPADQLPAELRRIAARVREQGHRLTGEMRLVLPAAGGDGGLEVQIGIAPWQVAK